MMDAIGKARELGAQHGKEAGEASPRLTRAAKRDLLILAAWRYPEPEPDIRYGPMIQLVRAGYASELPPTAEFSWRIRITEKGREVAAAFRQARDSIIRERCEQ